MFISFYKINGFITYIFRQISNRGNILKITLDGGLHFITIHLGLKIIVTTSQKPGKPEVTTVTKVAWNEDPYQ